MTWSDLEELDFQSTPIGDISLRRRRDPKFPGIELYEVKLGDEFLMSSLFHAAEDALADLGLAATEGDALDVAVGGLGLGYTAIAALRDPRVVSLEVFEFLPAVVSWHERRLVPTGAQLTGDPRCRFVVTDFFAHFTAPATRCYHAILLDVDHSPADLLHPHSAAFYSPQGLTALSAHLRPRGVFALWSNDPPDEAFIDRLATVFDGVEARVVSFPNPYQGRDATNTVYLARRR
jgi:spermidine synthase